MHVPPPWARRCSSAGAVCGRVANIAENEEPDAAELVEQRLEERFHDFQISSMYLHMQMCHL